MKMLNEGGKETGNKVVSIEEKDLKAILARTIGSKRILTIG